jgi:hypothetical protein
MNTITSRLQRLAGRKSKIRLCRMPAPRAAEVA